MKTNGILFSLMMLAVMLLNPVAAAAQNTIDPQALIGTWEGEPYTDKDKDMTTEVQIVQVYKDGHSCKYIEKITVNQDISEGLIKAHVICKCTATAIGTWALKGNEITYTFDKSKSTLTVDDVVVKSLGITIDDPSVVEMVKDEFKNEVKPDDMIVYPESFKIVSLEGNKMLQEDGDDTDTYTRK